MYRIMIFCEDIGHEEFIKAVLLLKAQEYKINIDLKTLNAIGGHGRVTSELKQFVKDLRVDKESLPDLIIVAIDCNCTKYQDVNKEVDDITSEFKNITITALPDPHIERWSLLDSSAFKNVFGKGCDAPDYKCERDKYKNLLLKSIEDTGIDTYIGGIEYFEDIVKAMDFERMENLDDTLSIFLRNVRSIFKKWSE